MIRKFKLGDLFTSSGISGLQIIQEMINKRVKQSDVVMLDDTGVPTGEWVESLEFKQLQSRGLEIMEVRIHNVLFNPTLEEQIIKNWSAEWLNIAQKEEKHLKEMEALIDKYPDDIEAVLDYIKSIWPDRIRAAQSDRSRLEAGAP